jgi:beta-glucuronidase
MMSTSRRRFLGAGSAALAVETASAAPRSAMQAEVSLDGTWQFRPDPKGGPQPPADGWSEVVVPHTWQVNEAWADYLGVAWYRREFDAPAEWSSSLVRVEFEAVYHTAEVRVNNERLGTHPGRGYTAFTIDITRALRFGAVNNILVRVDNSFRDSILPRANSYDWTPDGGITRPVRLLVTPPCYIESVAVDAVPDLATGEAQFDAVGRGFLAPAQGEAVALRSPEPVPARDTRRRPPLRNYVRGTPIRGSWHGVLPERRARVADGRGAHGGEPPRYRDGGV